MMMDKKDVNVDNDVADDDDADGVDDDDDNDAVDDTNIGGRAFSVVIPLIRRYPCQTKQGDRQGKVGRRCVDPHLEHVGDGVVLVMVMVITSIDSG